MKWNKEHVDLLKRIARDILTVEERTDLWEELDSEPDYPAREAAMHLIKVLHEKVCQPDI